MIPLHSISIAGVHTFQVIGQPPFSICWDSKRSSDAEIEASLDRLESRQAEHGGWDITWAVWTPAIKIEWSGLVTIAALKTLRSYGRV